MREALQSSGQLIGGTFGPMGSLAGKFAGSAIARIMGCGDYTVSQNTVAKGQAIPSFRSSADGMRICHREFVTDVLGSESFSNSSYPINPGLSDLFPWLSAVASNFEEYELKGLVFEYRPSSGSYSGQTNSASLGMVIAATNYDVLDAQFPTKQAMESYEFANSTVPFESMLHMVECAPNTNVGQKLYIRTTAPPINSDQRLYDRGLFQIATQGMSSAYTVGELWVTYDVILSRPRVNTQDGVGYAHIKEYPTSDGSTATPFGASGGVPTPGSSGIARVYGPTSILFPYAGNYLIIFSNCNSGTPTVASAPSVVSLGSNFTALQQLLGNTTYAALYEPLVDTRNSCLIATVNVISNGAGSENVLVFAGATGNSGAAISDLYTDLFVIPLPAVL